MFQNILESDKIDTKEELESRVNILSNVISKKYILLYMITLMVSSIEMGQGMSPFSIAIVTAVIANEIPVVAILLFALIGNILGCGVGSISSYIITMLIFFASFFVAQPKYNEESRNEKIKLGKRVFWSTLIVGFVKTMLSGFMLYDLLVAITTSITTLIFYKIFTNAVIVLTDFREKRAFTLEEVMGASLLLAIAICCLGDLSIFGYSVKNILSIFIVLVLGWKNGMLVGTTAGVSIGVALGIITGTEPIIIAAYAISGLVAGILNKFGKIGVIVGFIAGDVILTYASNGGVETLIIFQEILIAGLGLLAVPKNINLNIENIIGDNKFLPVGDNRRLNRSKETIEKLNNVSKAVKDMAETYNNAEYLSEEEIKETNKQTFITELLNYIDSMEENILYEQISKVDGPIIEEIFEYLIENQLIKEENLLEIFAKNNNYVVGFEDNELAVKRDVEKMTQAINSAYRISKINFIWSKKIREEKSNIEKQLKGVSKAISKIAENIKVEIKNENIYTDEKEQISLLLKQKEILVQEISINKKDDDRFIVEIYIEETNKKDAQEIISTIIEKVLKEKMTLNNKKAIEEEKCEKYTFTSSDKFLIEVGQALATKDDMSVSGDSILKIKLKDGKYLLAISDGMGSGPEARKSSQIVTKMLKRLLDSGFEKDTSLDLINSNLLNVNEEIFATLDIAIVDLYKGNIEMIKSGCCPTYVKNKRKVQVIKSLALPAGVIQDISKEVFDKDIENGDILVMCSDGILDSNVEYKNKELWVKYLMEDMENNNPQKIADIILQEAIDNNFGKIKDDMSVIVCKMISKT